MDDPLYLTPRLAPLPRDLLTAGEFLTQLVTGLGSPLNVVLPEQIRENVRAFRSVYDKHHLSGEILFAHKANRSSALLRELAGVGVGADVASLAELQHALGAGHAPARIIATGPKNVEFLWLCARTGVIVSLDSRDELTRLADLVAEHALPKVRVVLRMSAFEASGTTVLSRQSRFGVPHGELGAALDEIVKHTDQLDLVGVGYHLDTNGLPEKAAAFEGCLRAMDECYQRGLSPTAIDIGGGFGVNYLADGGEWERYTTALNNAVLGKRPAMAWEGYGYGLRNEGGTLRGSLGVYPCHRPVAAEKYFDELLSRTAPSLGRELATALLENLYHLHVEPGRALLDQCGLTLAKVLEVRRSGEDVLVRLDINSRDISMEEHGVLMDPIIVSDREPTTSTPARVYLIGNLCLEDDLITRRAVHLPRLPEVGELLAFANTAGYFMDFKADHALQQPIARKVAVHRDADEWRWCLDEEYWPVNRS